ncbi:MAG TPA: hypothetical protein VLJ86_22420 [Ramlibacter sp.]|nr:hypothetical protein [Ramlibacter sp.]
MIKRSPTLHARASATHSSADEAMAAGGSALDNTREFAAQALERAAEKMRDLRYGVADTATAAQRSMGRYANATTRYVAEQPMKSALMAAAVGAVVMAAILMARRRGGRY